MEERGQRRRVNCWWLAGVLLLCFEERVLAQLRYSVPEEAQVGSAVGNVAKDLGLDTSTLTDRRFRIVSGPNHALFQLNQNTGVLYVGEIMDREEICDGTKVCLINLKIVVESPLEIHYVGVEITDVNDHAPTFPENEQRLEIAEHTPPDVDHLIRGPLSNAACLHCVQCDVSVFRQEERELIFAQIKYSTQEEVKIGSVIGNVAKDLGLDVSTLPNRRFRIVSGAQDALFEVNPNNGVLYVHKNLDREQLCDRNGACSIDLKIVVENPLEVHYVTVEITDANDHVPSFAEKEKVIDIAETTLTGARFQLPAARDPDVGINSVQRYKLSQNDNFHLEIRDRGEDKIPFLVLQRILDREQKTNHSLILTALDGGTPPKSANLNLTIKVLDINDNRPNFLNEVYSVTLQENVALNTVVIKVQATDLDEGTNGDVEYSFGGDVNSKELFSLDRDTGEIRVNGQIDYETAVVYKLDVQASDKGQPPMTTDCRTFEIAEHTLPGRRFQLHTARDPDAGINSIRTYTLTSNEHFEVNIRQSDATKIPFLVLKKSLDREQKSTHTLLVTAVDGGKPPRSGTLNVSIIVLDINDNRPVFSQEMYEILIQENVSLGTSVFRMNATDPDEDNNGEVEYRLGKTLWRKVYDIFDLDKLTGEIRIKGEVDYEEKDEYELVVEASDKGTPPLTGECRVIIKIKDVNDNPPEIEVTSLSDTVSEDSKPGTVISLISLIDKDSGVNGKMISSITSDVPFELKPSFKENIYSVVTKGFLDREKVSYYDIIIKDKASGQLRYSISEEIKEGTAVGNIAKDLGIDPNILKARGFRIVSGSTEPLFQVNQNDGILYVNRNIDREEICQRTTVCLINLKSVLENPLEIHYVAVEVLDVNDHSPSFPENNKRLEISESTSPGTRFQLHAALDPDGGVNSVQQYKLNQNSHFRLEVKDRGKDGKVPILQLQSPLDREASSSHKLLLTAMDGGKPPNSGSMEIVIDVLDVNDNAPVFTKDVYSADINENSPIGTLVIRVNATDLDEGLNGEVSYSFGNVNSKVREMFDVDPSTGEITVRGRLDYEVEDSYEIDIQASDSGVVPFRTEKSVTVNVKDMNDNAPVIEVTSLSDRISEDSRPGTTVALLSITDLDSGVNGKVISSVNGDVPFTLTTSIQDNMYAVVTKSQLDREDKAMYDVTVLAKDAGEPALTSEKTFRVVVSDVNDNSPEFLMSRYHFYVTENNPPGPPVFSLFASDRDEGDNAREYKKQTHDLSVAFWGNIWPKSFAIDHAKVVTIF
ncbi:hypothetical protein F2P81_007589 [Scophthalmus maximus]|uniref:Uncharacterized protein n=1 Tax=Scophthalmus maximus TaxID=52904 RepID=A0A6A4T826_SCOMX|nr:hypothetical protein F2P81_007589 [Scophthalmus maximus]